MENFANDKAPKSKVFDGRKISSCPLLSYLMTANFLEQKWIPSTKDFSGHSTKYNEYQCSVLHPFISMVRYN